MKTAKHHNLIIARVIGLLPLLIVGCNKNNDEPINGGSSESTPSNNSNNPIKPINYEEIINNPSSFASLSNDELISFYSQTKKLPEQYLFLDENYVIKFSIDSASSIEEANNNSKERVHDERNANSKNIPTSSEVLYEGDTYYVTHIGWNHITDERTSSYTADAICFKSQYVDFVPPVPTQGKEFSMTIKDFSKVQEIIDLYEYSADARTASYKLVTSVIKEESSKYVYQNYFFQGIGGDWGMKDTVNLYLKTYEISKTSGKAVAFEKELVNTAEEYNVLY